MSKKRPKSLAQRIQSAMRTGVITTGRDSVPFYGASTHTNIKGPDDLWDRIKAGIDELGPGRSVMVETDDGVVRVAQKPWPRTVDLAPDGYPICDMIFTWEEDLYGKQVSGPCLMAKDATGEWHVDAMVYPSGLAIRIPLRGGHLAFTFHGDCGGDQ